MSSVFGCQPLAHDAGVSDADQPVEQPEAAFWGGYSSYVADPDGHLWELAHKPHLPLNADGSPQLAE